MSLPISVTYTFANATTSTYLAYLDSNFTTVTNGINGIGNGTNALANVNITGGTAALTTPLAPTSGGTGLSSIGASGTTIISNGTTYVSTPAASAVAIQGAYKNLKIKVNSTSNISATVDQIVLFNGTTNYLASTVSLTISASASGVNGIDTGTIAPSTWYSVWVIYNSTTLTTAGLLSTSATTPTLPSGYTYSARIGWVYSNSGSSILKTTQYNNKAQYVTPVSMITGASSAWTTVAVSAFVPTTASQINVIGYQSSTGGTGVTLLVAPNNAYSTTGSTPPPPIQWSMSGYTNYESWTTEMTLETTNIYYGASSSVSGLTCWGWTDNL